MYWKLTKKKTNVTIRINELYLMLNLLIETCSTSVNFYSKICVNNIERRLLNRIISMSFDGKY